MALKRITFQDQDDDNEISVDNQGAAQTPPAQQAPAPPPAPTPQPQQPAVGPPPLPGKRPTVPRELMSARPAMTKVVPRSPDAIQAASQATAPTPPTPLTPEEEAERQQRIEYLRSIRKPDKKHGSKKWLIIVIIALLLTAAGLGAAYWYLNRDSSTPAKKTPAASTTANNPTQQAAPAADVQFKDYTSTNFALGLKYPADWTLSDTANALTIVSPVQQLPGADGKQTNGAVLVTIRHQQPSLPEFKTGNAVAVLDSKNVNYSAPAAGQRGTTFLSYLQYASTTTKGALDGIYITGNAGYKKTQTVPQADIIKVDPLVTVTFLSCTSACAPGGQSTQVNADSWAASPLNTTVETILKSLSLN